MSDITISYKGNSIATMDASGTKTLLTEGKYCEDDIDVVYVKPASPSGTKQISITQNGTTTEDVAAYASAEISVSVSGSSFDYTDPSQPSGAFTSNATSGWPYMFAGRTGITSISMPLLQTIPGQMFFNATGPTSINLPIAQIASVTQQAFSGCTNLQGLVLPSATNPPYASYFYGCSNLEYIDLKVTGFMQNQTFTNDAKLETIILRHTSVVSLGHTNSFNGTPFASGGTGGHIYIPKALYDALGTGTNDYKAASNWSTINGYGTITWHAIEGSYYETHYADGTVIS